VNPCAKTERNAGDDFRVPTDDPQLLYAEVIGRLDVSS
jgi:hypothetical protein